MKFSKTYLKIWQLLLKKKKNFEDIWTWERLNREGASSVTDTGWDQQMHKAITPCVDVCGLPALRLFLLLGNDKSPLHTISVSQ